MRRVIGLVALASSMLMACGSDTVGGGGGGDRLLVLAAASLTDAFADIATAFEAGHPDIDVQVNYAGSSALREQILQGAPADVFASANEETMQAVATAGGLAGEPSIFATNSLVVAVPAGNPGAVTGLADLGDDSLLIGLCATGVPCGDAARAVLANAGIDAAIDTAEPDVRALLTKIGAGELDAGIVYTTDVIGNDRVDSMEIADSLNVRVRYPVAVLAEAPRPAEAADFVEFVHSPAGQAILARFGFGAP